MNVFLRRIPANTNHIDISEFFRPGLKRGFLRPAGKLIKVEIMALQDIRIGTIEYHGLVTLDSEASMQNAVMRLKNHRLNGRVVVVRPFFQRSWYNDPRQKQGSGNEAVIERRKGDRRRGRYLQIIKNITDRFNNQDEFLINNNQQDVLINFVMPGDLVESVMFSINSFQNERTTVDSLFSHSAIKPMRFLVEQDADQQCLSVQTYIRKKESLVLLEHLKAEFAESGIKYWVLPVMEQGDL